ncbi:putative Thioredoxin [Herminiimonas arsenicoxydans]|uniref:Thioredoxin n=1 Tax=Herminiimonas arsenicoxydans TaxID=204773 RepID=A4G2L3_HERAR|nr:putative Thioredoxin [Herminiimonas arsenicoxydans]
MNTTKSFAHKNWLKAVISRSRTFIICLMLAAGTSAAVAQTAPVAEVWKDASCGCCGEWVRHMEEAGFKVKVHNEGNAEARKRLGMPVKYGSCHTTKVGKYVVEGHVPAADIKRLLQEKPAAKGLAAPGMPVGSPGMDGPDYDGQKDAYDVLLIKNDGSSSVYQSHR